MTQIIIRYISFNPKLQEKRVSRISNKIPREFWGTSLNRPELFSARVHQKRSYYIIFRGALRHMHCLEYELLSSNDANTFSNGWLSR